MAARRKIMPDLFCHEAEAAFLMLFNPDDGRYRPDRDASRYEDAVAELTRNNWFSDDEARAYLDDCLSWAET